MPTRPAFTQADPFAFWNDLAAYPAAETDAMLAHFFRAILPVLHAGTALWTLLVRLGTGPAAENDLCHGWRTREILLSNSCFCFDRVGQPEEPFFSAQETELAGTILGGLGWFHRRLVASRHVGAGQSPPTPTEGRILRGLLTGQSEKQIADALGQSVYTTHDHVRAVYRKFGVQSRVELMALRL